MPVRKRFGPRDAAVRRSLYEGQRPIRCKSARSGRYELGGTGGLRSAHLSSKGCLTVSASGKWMAPGCRRIQTCTAGSVHIGLGTTEHLIDNLVAGARCGH